MANASDSLNQELLSAFCDESIELVNQLDSILTEIENGQSQYEKLENFGQVIDRIMGTSKTLQLSEISTFCELGKTIGYKAGQSKDIQLLNVVVAVLFDTTFLLRKMVEESATGNQNILSSLNTKAFTSRLKWLSQKFTHIERSSVSASSDDQQLSQANIDDLLKDLGL